MSTRALKTAGTVPAEPLTIEARNVDAAPGRTCDAMACDQPASKAVTALGETRWQFCEGCCRSLYMLLCGRRHRVVFEE